MPVLTPNGIDGAIGRGTKRAASKYKESKATDLADITKETAANWCQHFNSVQGVPESKVKTGIYRAVFSSLSYEGSKRIATNRCGMLTVDYEKGHLYRYGLCNDDKTGIADNVDVLADGNG